MIYGNTYNLRITVANTTAVDQDLDTIVKSEKLIKITPTVNMYLLLTASSQTADADAEDYLLLANTEYEFSVGTGVDRISLFNNSGGSGFAHVMLMY